MSDNKLLEFGQVGRDKMMVGISKLHKAVVSTLGPRGRNVVIQLPGGRFQSTKDGVSVSNAIFLKDPYESIGCNIIKEVAQKQVDTCGDGTTSAICIAHSILQEGMRMVAASHDPMQIKRGIDKAVVAVVDQVALLSREVSSSKEIAQVATISANGDSSIGNMIAEAMERVGKDGIISLEEGSGLTDELVMSAGFEFDRGFKLPHFINVPDRQEVVFENALVWLIDGVVSSKVQLDEMMPVLDYCNKHQKPLLIVAENIDGEVLATLAINALRKSLPVVCVRAPGYGDTRTEMLEDLASLTSATLRRVKAGEELLLDMQIEELGLAKKIVCNKERTVIVGADGCESSIEEQSAKIRAAIEISEPGFSSDTLKKRLAKLISGVAVIRVAATTELEAKEKKDRFEDALAATRCAVAEGIVPGGSVALVRAAKALEGFTTGNHEEDVGVKIVLAACLAPLKQISQNAGDSGEVTVAKVKDELTGNFGYNAASRTFVDMFDAGIIDPAQVVRVSLQSAASVCSLLLTTECVIVADEAEKTAN